MPRLKAKLLLDEVDAGRIELHPNAIYDAALLATDSEQVANAYRCAAIKSKWRPR
jgi:hypothetical protein